MDKTNQMLQVSAKLYKLLTSIPPSEDRTSFIQEINTMLDERGNIVEQLKEEGFRFDSANKLHRTLQELDNGIRDGLKIVFDNVKTDIKNLNAAKKQEMQYINPYANVRVMDGRYYDKKK